MKLKKRIDKQKVHLLNEAELIEESNRLESLLQRGELSVKECRRLGKIRAAMENLDDMKCGA